ncbi:MAG: aspartate--tRNA ligase [Thermoanaerobaculia bacterium]
MRKYCGLVFKEDLGKEVILYGWVDFLRDVGNIKFILLRDREGVVQIVADKSKIEEKKFEIVKSLNLEDCIKIKGDVVLRDEKNINPKMKTGEIEILLKEIEILGKAEALPFTIEEDLKATENLRLKYRYLDLRRKKMQEVLKLRHLALQKTRNFLAEKGFWEIETPILTKSTPEGARDFLVPSRLQKGKFYALPQSPQLFKQLCMVSGLDRYFQIARCFRDEDLRADRQPEFTQIDIEASFIKEEDIFEITEGLLIELFNLIDLKLQKNFPRLKFEEAMEKYGSDKPDLRIPLEIKNLSKILDENTYCLNFQNTNFSRKELDLLKEAAEKNNLKFSSIKWEGGFGKSNLINIFGEEKIKNLKNFIDAKDGDITIVVSGKEALKFLGEIRIEKGKEKGFYKDGFYPLWITDFPLLEWNEEEKRWDPCHHPFTSPREEDLEKLEIEPEKVKARAYDIVLNGYEIGGGSIRINRSEVQKRLFKVIGIDEEKAKEKFGFLLEAFRYGAPPHGGIALGFDRIVMLLAGLSSIRDCIPFPKTTTGSCLMTDAPSEVEEKQLKELGIKLEE